MECISFCLNHFRVIEVLEAQKNRHLKTDRSAIVTRTCFSCSFRPVVSMRATLILNLFICPLELVVPPIGVNLNRGADFSPFRGVCKPPAAQRSAGSSTSGQWERHRKGCTTTVVSAHDVQFAANLLHQRLDNFHSKSFAADRIEFRRGFWPIVRDR